MAGSSSRVIQTVEGGAESTSCPQRILSKEKVLLETDAFAVETSNSRSAQQPAQDDRYATLSIYSTDERVESNNNPTRLARKENSYLYIIGVTGYFQRLRELWINRRCRRALLSAGVAMISQQMTGNSSSCLVRTPLRTIGVNTIAFLGTAVWQNSLGPAASAKVSAIIGLVFGISNYLGGLPVSQGFAVCGRATLREVQAYWLSDRVGRSIMLAIGLPNMAWSMLVFAMLFQIPETSSARVPLVSVFAVIFTLFYAPTAVSRQHQFYWQYEYLVLKLCPRVLHHSPSPQRSSL